MASGLITSWQIGGEIVAAVTDFIFLCWQITADGDYSEIERYWLVGRKEVTNLDSVLKSRDITWLTKVHIINAMVFSVVTNRCKSYTIKDG